MGAGLVRQVVTALAALALVSATACSGGDDAEGSATGATEPATSVAVETVEAEEVDPAAWRIRANAECNSMIAFYEAVFRRRGQPKRAQVTAAAGEALRNWHAGMGELGAPEGSSSEYEEALALYDEAIAAFGAGKRGAAAFEEANRLFEGLGLDVCVDVIDLVRSGEDPDAEPVVIHEEGFSSVLRRWSTSRNDEIALGYVNGKYRVRVLDPPGDKLWSSSTNWAGGSRPTVRVEVDTVLKDRASGVELFGVLCLNARNRGYVFAIGPPEQRWSIIRLDEEFEIVEEGSGEDAIRQRVNHVGGDCRARRDGTLVRLFVNGKVAGSYLDREGYRGFRSVGVAVYAPEGGLEVLFDNARATELRRTRTQ